MYYNQSTVRKMYNILLVEDDKNIREMLVEYFSKRDKEKFNITLAENGLKGLDKAYENSYDLLLLDVMLPEMDGFTLCKEIRRYSDVPIMFITARTHYIAIALCLVAAGTIGYFALRERPVTVEQTDTPPVLDIQPVTPTQPVVKPAPVVIPDPVEEAEITEPAELLPQVVSPLDGTTVTVFSMTELLYDPTMADWRTHDGIDVQADEGAAVKTAAAGTVQSVTDDELMGTTVVIQHDGGYATQYSSLQENTPVAQGQTVAAGEVIGYVGSTSAAESRMGPHLHFSVSRDGAVIDPHDYVNGGE